jgi:integrase
VRTRAQQSQRPFTIPEIQAVLSVADPEWQSLIKFGFYTGQRLGDVAALRWSNIDLARDELRLVTAKTGRRMLLPISEGLRAHIESLPCPDDPIAPLHPRAAARIIKEQNAVAQALIGHDGRESHQDYISIDWETLRKAAAVLPTI